LLKDQNQKLSDVYQALLSINKKCDRIPADDPENYMN